MADGFSPSDFNAVVQTVAGGVASFVPTLSNQLNQWIDNTRRNAYDPNILAQEARGTFSPDTNTITLTPNANLSTFLVQPRHWPRIQKTLR